MEKRTRKENETETEDFVDTLAVGDLEKHSALQSVQYSQNNIIRTTVSIM